MQLRSLALAAGALIASTVFAEDFPAGASTPDAHAVKDYLADRNFNMPVSNAQVWRLDYKPNGYLFFASGAYTDSGTWRAEDGKVCHALQKSKPSCNEVRMHEGVLLIKRDNGEIARFIPR